MAPARPARASVFDLWPLRETLTRSCDFPLKGSSGSRVTCGPRVSPLHAPSSDLEIFDTAEVGSGSIQEIPPKVLQEIQARITERLVTFQLKELVSYEIKVKPNFNSGFVFLNKTYIYKYIYILHV